MPRLAYLSANKDDFYRRLNRMMDIAARSLKIKRGVITKLLEEGLYPYTKRYLGNFNNHFSTIGLVGMNEAGLNANWLRADLSDGKTQEFVKEVLNHMRNRLSDYQEMYGDLYNLEATPAESTAYRLAKHDKKRWPGIQTAGSEGDTPYYTNSSHLPVNYTADIFDALDIQDELQTLYTSGTVFHAFWAKNCRTGRRRRVWSERLPRITGCPIIRCRRLIRSAGSTDTWQGRKNMPALRQGDGGIQPYYRILPAGTELERWKTPGICKPQGIRRGEFLPEAAVGEPCDAVRKAERADVKIKRPENIKYLFTTKTCPNCKLAKEYLQGEQYVTIDAEENTELAYRYGVMQAPTLVVVNGDDFKKYVNVSNIRKYMDAVVQSSIS